MAEPSRRPFQSRHQVLHYFAFGSNMNPARVRERGLRFDRIIGGRLPGYCLSFDKSANEHPHSGHANIAWAPQDVVEGVLYRLVDEQQILLMDPFEQTPINYSRELVQVNTDAGLEVAWTYIANPARRRPHGRPERAYLAHLLEGRPWLSADYHARLVAWPVVDEAVAEPLQHPVGADLSAPTGPCPCRLRRPPISKAMTEPHDCCDLIRLFDDLFAERYHVRLCGGADEPLYAPAAGQRPAMIHFRADYFASALHEVAHWCTAGSSRRRLLDYGYWYAPDGRDAGAQAAFEQAEVGPQALEWLFADACGYPFRPSLDNLDGGSNSKARFQQALALERARRLQQGMPPRAGAFCAALATHFGMQGRPSVGSR